MLELPLDSLHGALADPALSSMNLLNDIASTHPTAISFAAGRPFEDLFQVNHLHEYLDAFTAHLSQDLGLSAAQVRRTLFQYGRTKGVMHHLVAKYLEVDEGIRVDPESIVVTVGAQEAMFLVLRALRTDERDAVLAVMPAYFGLTGAARLLDMPVIPVASGSSGIDLDDLGRQLTATRKRGLRARALYLVPDFSNPTGISLDLPTRRRLLDIAAEQELLVIEDDAYGLFHADPGQRLPTLKALDTERVVLHIGSFAKTGLPGARVGFVVADQTVTRGGVAVGPLADQLSLIKSNITLNTSPVAQAIVGGKLLRNGYSMLAANKREIEIYRLNLRRVLTGLARRFPAGGPVHWNMPGGGFFIVVTVPFPVDDSSLERSAREHGVIWTPMHHFYAHMAHSHQLRLSFSLLTPEAIDEGLDRLARFVASESQRS